MLRSPFICAVVTLIASLLAVDADQAIAERGIKEGAISEDSLQPTLAVVGEDPYTNQGTYHRTQVEPDSSSFGSKTVSVFQSGRSYRCGASNIGWSVSNDAGLTWTHGFLPSTTVHATPPGPWKRASDPVVAYDAKHDTWLALGLGIRSCPFTGGDPFVSRSTDGAQTFGEPVTVQREEQQSELFDKPWIACDNTPTSPFYGNCYVLWDDEGHHLRLDSSTSTDGGLTWSQAEVRRDTRVIGGQPVVQPNGTVVIVTPQCCPTRIDSFISRDGGATYSGHGTNYSGPLAIHKVRARAARGRLRWLVEPPFPSSDVDAGGNIYVVWPDCRFRNAGQQSCTNNDLVLSTSADGRHWSHVARIPTDPIHSPVDHFLPAIAVDPTTSGSSAHIAIVYYFYPDADCSVATCDLSVGFVSSTDGGATWNSQQLAGPFRTTWFPLTPSGYMVGDYFSVSFVDGKAVAVFIVGTKGTCELEDITSCNVWTASATAPLVP